MSRMDPADCRDAIIDLLERRLERNNTYVQCRIVADRLNITPQQAGVNLGLLAEQGVIDRWDESNRGTIWRINPDAFADENGGGASE